MKTCVFKKNNVVISRIGSDSKLTDKDPKKCGILPVNSFSFKLSTSSLDKSCKEDGICPWSMFFSMRISIRLLRFPMNDEIVVDSLFSFSRRTVKFSNE